MFSICWVNDIISNFIKYIFSIKPEREEYSKKVTNNLNNWPSQGAIEFCDYTVRYRKNLPRVLKNVTLSIKSCEKVNFRILL